MRVLIVLAAIAVLAAASVDCGDGSACPDGTTCCELQGGGYGCCPYEEATCCEDKQHCCPNGYQCDLQTMTCTQSRMMGPNSVQPILRVQNRVRSVDCGDGSACPDGTTCCELQGGGYGCCPYEEATCCEDKQHCCPNGYQCDLSTMTCTQSDNSLMGSARAQMFETEKATPKSVDCGDGSSCPDGSTCCELQGGGYGCCPYEEATCCEDKLHCCPNGYQCDLSSQTCTRGKGFGRGLFLKAPMHTL